MGLFDRGKQQMDEAMKMAQQQAGTAPGAQAWMDQAVAAAQADVAANDAAIGEVPDGDPRLEPIDGISFDRYAELCRLMGAAGMDTAKHEEIAVANGVPAGTWSSISERWNARILGDKQMTLKLNKAITGR